MITKIYLILEIVCIIIIIHYLYGEKFKLSIWSLVLICVDIILCEIVISYKLSDNFTLAMQPIIMIYSYIEFHADCKHLIINFFLYFVILGLIQLISSIIIAPLFIVMPDDVVAICINLLSILLVYLLNCLVPLYNLTRIIIKHKKVYILLIIILLVFYFYKILEYKSNKGMQVSDYILLTVCVGIICVLVYNWRVSEMKRVEKEHLLKLHELYDDSFSKLIEEIKDRQHDLSNHINAIYSQHYICNTYEELVSRQKEYCIELCNQNKYSKLLSTTGNSILTGFLYNKFIEVNEKGIDIEYTTSIETLNSTIPDYIIIEMVGILLDNAVEAQEDCVFKGKHKYIYFELCDDSNEFYRLVVMNPNDYISVSEISNLFKRNISTKGKGRGIGLNKVNKYCKEYNCSLIAVNEKKYDINHFKIKILFPKKNM